MVDLASLDVVGLVPGLVRMGVPVAARVAPPDPGASSPYAAERAAVARAVPARRAEFLTGRLLARAALADLGVAPSEIARRPDRAPAWPAGLIGSITHTGGLCAALVARPAGSGAIIGVGIDVELDVRLDDAVIDRVLTPGERGALGARRGRDAVVAFSAKEALFKAIHPATGVWLEPIEVEVVLGHDDAHWSAAVTPGPEPGPTSGPVAVRSWAAAAPGVAPVDAVGRWARVGPWVLTGFVLASPGVHH